MTPYEMLITQVKGYVNEIRQTEDSLDVRRALSEQGMDSLDQVEVLMELEDGFSIYISDEDAEKLHTIHDIVTYLMDVHGVRPAPTPSTSA